MALYFHQYLYGMYSLLWPLAPFATATSLGRTSFASPPPTGVVAPSGGPASGFRAEKSGNMAAQLGRNPYFLHLLVCSMGREDETERKGSRRALPEAKNKKKRAALSGNRTRVACVGGKHDTTTPTVRFHNFIERTR